MHSELWDRKKLKHGLGEEVTCEQCMEGQVGVSQVRECRCAGLRVSFKGGSDQAYKLKKRIRGGEELKIKEREGMIDGMRPLGSLKDDDIQ